MQQIKMILKVTKSMDREKDIHLLVTKINQFDYTIQRQNVHHTLFVDNGKQN